MSVIGAIVTTFVGLFGLLLWQEMVRQNRAHRKARYRKARRPVLRVIRGGKA